MRNGIFGWDLPPGCSVSDIPGNRPEDEKWENILESFWDSKHCTDKQYKRFEDAKLDGLLVDIVDKAIEYGMELGRQEQISIGEENKYYKTLAKEYEENKAEEKE